MVHTVQNTPPEMQGEFVGAKLALFIGSELVVLRRDDRPDIPWPDYLDLPGGGRETGETPEDCVLRETWEEVGLRLPVSALVHRHAYARPSGWDWFFAAHLPAGTEAGIVFGNEGQGWCLMPPDAFIAHPKAVPYFQKQVAHYLEMTATTGRVT